MSWLPVELTKSEIFPANVRGIQADIENWTIDQLYDTIVVIGLLMFFRHETALKLLTAIQDRKGANLTFPQSYIISEAVMSALRSNHWRLAFLPLLLTASLLFPTLHLHPVHDHDHDGHSHQHAIIHADFLSVSAQDHRYLQQRAAALGDVSPWVFSQSGLSALLTRSIDSLLAGLEKSPQFFLLDVVVAPTRLVIFAHILKQEHPPPVQQGFLASNAPRSPPRLV